MLDIVTGVGLLDSLWVGQLCIAIDILKGPLLTSYHDVHSHRVRVPTSCCRPTQHPSTPISNQRLTAESLSIGSWSVNEKPPLY